MPEPEGTDAKCWGTAETSTRTKLPNEIHFAVSTVVPGLMIVSVDKTSYQLLGESQFLVYALLGKNDVTIGRSNGVLSVYEAMNYLEPVYQTAIPEDIDPR